MSATNIIAKNEVFEKPLLLLGYGDHFTLRQKRLRNLIMKKGLALKPTEAQFRITNDEIELFVQLGNSRNEEWSRKFRDDFFTTVEWREQDKNGKWRIRTMPLLADLITDDEGFLCEINAKTTPVFEEARARLDEKLELQMLAQTSVTRSDSLDFFEHCMGLLKKAGNPDALEEVRMTEEEVRRAAGIKKGKHKGFGVLNRDVVEPMCKDISKATEIRVTPRARFKGKAGIGFEFTIRVKKDHKYKVPEFELKGRASPLVKELRELMESCDVDPTIARQLAAMYPEDQIRRNVAYAKEVHAKDPRDVLGGFTKRAIEKNWRKQDVVEEKRKRVAKASDGVTAKPVEIVNVEKEFASQRAQWLDEHINSQSEEWLMDMRQAFADTGFRRSLFDDMKEELDWSSEWVQSDFRGWLASRVLTEPHQIDIDLFAEWRCKSGRVG